MYLIPKINLNKKIFFSIILAAFPFSFIAGNMIININILLIVFSALIIFWSSLLNIKFFFLDKLILSYFFLILFTALVNDFYFYSEKMAWRGYFGTITKSIFFLRYLFLYFILRFLIEKNFIDIKYFFLSSTIAVLFVSFDIFYQFFNGKDIFGFAGQGRKLSGPFGNELIAGGFIQRYALFAFFLIPLFFKEKNFYKYIKYIVSILFTIFLISLILSGNRMPTIMFLFYTFMIMIFQKNVRKFFVPFLIIFSLIFFTLFQTNHKIRNNFLNLYAQVTAISSLATKGDFFNKQSPQYLKEFTSFYHTWLINKYIGGGIKNFRYYCHERSYIPKNEKFVCNMHPHNYYLEILTETGLIGFLFILLIFSKIIYLTFVKKYFLNSNIKNNVLIIPLMFLFLAEIFPIKSTGSFFTTGNSTYLFLIMGLIVGILQRENLIEKKN